MTYESNHQKEMRKWKEEEFYHSNLKDPIFVHKSKQKIHVIKSWPEVIFLA